MIGLAPPGARLDILCVGAHPDDIEIGCGGTLLGLVGRPATTVAGLVLTGSPERREEAGAALPEFFPDATVRALDLPDGRLPAHWDAVKDALEECAAERRPTVVMAPRADDAHQDHRLLGELVSTVWRDALILHYEIPKWDGDFRSPNVYVRLTESDARRKVELLSRCFPSQVAREWWDDELFSGVMRLRGMESRSRYAEGFVCDKLLLDLDAGSTG
ncbi:N-acetylglucosaminyl deacetylase, LmbE family [Geodermatophilus pulveris]|uniref:N-acetylglucosaminyl deacetylase, LmbE family n=1 Tax=Geodermatophilus pulveris TaxID=1564159 RepID=A0A239J902_9ACTN|nr:PIG-L deacetylase family protein [Geodermatophilus pulveris]SNT02112.1 N-acetylglucosaminyl deacetylase, LmbE family [Geodermatophilus pulveris]